MPDSVYWSWSVFAAAGFKKTADEWECLLDQSPTVSHPSETATSWVGTGTVSPETESLFILLERLSSWEDSSGGKNTFITRVCQYRMHFFIYALL